MRAVRYEQSGLTLGKVAAPDAGPGEALVRVTRAAIGPTDLAIFKGTLKPPAPITIGHEFVGVVEQVSLPADAPASLASRKSLQNKRVVASPTVVCGHCDMCRAGLSAHCRSRQVVGLVGRNGCLAEFITLPLANLMQVPDPLDDDAAVFAASVAHASHAAQIARTAAKAFITVLSTDTDPGLPGGPADLSALLVTKILSLHNASARLLSRSEPLLAVADRWAIKNRPLQDAGRRQDQDVVVDCSASSAGLRTALQMVRPRGTIVLASPTLVPPFPAGVPLPEAAPPAWARGVDLTPALANEVSILACRDGQPGASEALHLLARGELDVRSLVSKRLKLDDPLGGLRAADQEGSLKVLIDP
ncbi:MAG: alcohol dehydrogenase catalytic domain-containing protein [Phycisphaeraceae bacterium]|nr:alcohol dehydrogenase catalytic domain-containing protein [Phycisphaeraceae bacterium]